MLKNKNNKFGKVIAELLNKARTFYRLGLLEQANDLYQSVLQKDVKNISALRGLALIARDAGMFDESISFTSNALTIDENNIDLIKDLALTCTRKGCIKFAIEQYHKVLAMVEDEWVTGELARLYLLSGKMDEALSFFKKAYSLNPLDPGNFHGFLQLDRSSITKKMVEDIEALLASDDLPLNNRVSFNFALGSLFDGDAEYDKAFENFASANIAKGLKYDAEDHEKFVSHLINTFTVGFFNECQTSGSDSEVPVFIVGMPRSGTSLTEQILSSHPQVAGAGELSLIENMLPVISKRLHSQFSYPECLDVSSQEVIAELAEIYLAHVHELMQPEEIRVTDKMPVNFMHLGLIALLFPRAKIIHCKRNPLDVCLSCYFSNFSGKHDYSGDLQDLSHYYQQYERIMAHWSEVLPLQIHEVVYEDLIDRQLGKSKALINFVGLEWDEICLDFYRTENHVYTASVAQVRKPVYQTSVERWRNYDKCLQTIKKEFGVMDVMLKPARINTIKSHENINTEKKHVVM